MKISSNVILSFPISLSNMIVQRILSYRNYEITQCIDITILTEV